MNRLKGNWKKKIQGVTENKACLNHVIFSKIRIILTVQQTNY